MYGPDIVARTINKPTVRGTKSKREWQYHGRSDVHSKVACWAVLFDLLDSCDIFNTQATQGKISFAVNHLMVGPINKTLDLVICAVPKGRKPRGRRTFAQLGEHYGIQLSPDDQTALAGLPVIEEELSSDVSEVLIALEAKACFTDLVGSIPRLHAEILATGYLAKQAAPSCITVSYTLVNGASSFVSPGKQGNVKKHSESEAKAVLDMIRKAIPTAHNQPAFGYDVIGASLIECRNDGSQVKILNTPPAPAHTDFIYYERMMTSLCGVYRSKFGHR
jgi:hypothetical protein